MNMRIRLSCLALVSLYSWNVKASDQVPVVQVEELKLTELSDEFTYPARVTSKIQGTLSSDIDGVVVKVLAPLGQKVGRGSAVFMIKNTDPVYEYVPVKILSPVSGIVSSIDIAEGTMVRKGQKLGSIVDPSQALVEIEIPTNDLGFFQRGLSGQFQLQEGVQFPVVVEGVSPLVDPVTGTASAQLRPTGKSIPLGVVGKAIFKTNIRKSLQVIESAIIMRGPESLVRVVKDSKAKLVPVKIASTKKGYCEIASGVEAGSTIIVSSSRFVADGQEVSVQKSDVAKK